jgi:hypothetical protein
MKYKIVWEIKDSGEATNIRAERDNYILKADESSEPGERISKDISKYHLQKYRDSHSLESQKSKCIQLRREAEYHFSPCARFKDPADRDS